MALTKRQRVELALLKEERIRLECIRSFSAFVKQAWHVVEPGTPYVHGWHIDAISLHLEACLRGQLRNLLINMPPRHMKSTLISVLFPAWVWIKCPQKKWIFSSYAESLSKRDSIKCRLLIESQWYQSFFSPYWTMARDQNEKMRFMNDMLGYRIATSVGGSATGEGGDFLVADDPHNAKEIHSDVIRKGVIQWWDEVISTRGNDPKTVCKIIVMQRLHDEDLAGHVLKKGGYHHLVLPAEYEGQKNRTALGWEDPRNEVGDLLWPQRFGREEVEQLKVDLGSQAAAGQLQQRPSAATGNIFQRQWWKFYRELPARLDVVIQSWDLAVKDKTGNDFTVGLVMARRGADKYVIDCVRARMAFPAQCQSIRTLSMKHPTAHKKCIEAKANGPAVIAQLKREISGLVEVEPMGDKVARANAASPSVEAGNVYLPDPSIAPWVHDFIEELASFPNAVHDDQVDAFSQGISELMKAGPTLMPIAGHGSGTIHR